MHALIATDSVHTTAAACDYLDSRELDMDDAVTVVSVAGADPHDADDALNVANARLLGRTRVETERLTTDNNRASAILAAVADRSPDLVIIGSHAGLPEADQTLGNTAKQLIEAVEIPIVVVPLSF